MKTTSTIQLHAFGDASKKAYAAVVYIRVTNDNSSKSWILASNTRVAPVKSQTIPRLELSAALLASRLLHRIQGDLKLPEVVSYAWTDSKVALSWILEQKPERWPVFIANRGLEIKQLLPDTVWSYVNTKQNLADLASRGVKSEKLINNSLWWQGPQWLSQNMNNWPAQLLIKEYPIPEKLITLTSASPNDPISSRFSCLERLQRVIAVCLRVKKQVLVWKKIPKSEKLKRLQLLRSKTINISLEPNLSVMELNDALIHCIWCCQRVSFPEEIECLSKNKPIKHGSQLLKLSPFLDHKGILRFGGRLEHSQLSYEEKHPAILLGKSHLSHLIIDWAHRMALHGGFKVTYSYVLRKVWLINGIRSVKSLLRNYVTSVKAIAMTMNQKMAQLPSARVNPSPPFTETGIDYAGPIYLHQAKGRGAETYKGYIALFVCLCTKAIHLEIVGDLTTESFLGALKRFISRRGRPAKI